MQFIDKVGVEIEAGLIDTNLSYPLKDNWSVTNDGSISSYTHVAKELVSEPFPIKSINKLFADIKNIYSIIGDINDSMGFHIHISFREKRHYMNLASLEFCKYFFNKLQSDNVLWSLIHAQEQNRYRWASPEYKDCYQIDTQIAEYDKSECRYKMLNFAYNQHRTIECRIFPAMESANEAIYAIKFYIKTVNQYLSDKLYKHIIQIQERLDKTPYIKYIRNEIIRTNKDGENITI